MAEEKLNLPTVEEAIQGTSDAEMLVALKKELKEGNEQ